MNSPDIRLSTEQVRRHADMVDESSRMLDEALAGAVHVRASNESYGKLVGWLFVPMLNPQQDRAIDEIKKAVGATQGLADRLRAMAANVDMTDEAAANRLRDD